MRRKRILAIILALVLSLSLSITASAATLSDMLQPNDGIKNIIVMVPDGMSIANLTLTRWYNAYDEATGKIDPDCKMALDEMASGLVRNWWIAPDGTIGAITDSAPAATAMGTGVKSNNKFLGVDENSVPVASILEAAKLAGKSTGVVATSQVMHATPAGWTSHYPDRSQEEIIAEQQVYNNVDVVFGAGWNRLAGRADNENLISVLKSGGYNYVTTAEQLEGLTGKTWGMFASASNSAMRYEMDRLELKPEEPSLAEMTTAALNILSQNPNGFYVMIEGSKVDWANHANDPIGVISDVNAFDDAVRVALDFAKSDGQTMVIAVTDHGCGGITIGDDGTSVGYDSAPVTRFIEPLYKAKLTGEGIEDKFDEDRTNIVEVMSEWYGIDDLTEDEIAEIKEYPAGSMNYCVGPMISKRANIGWTTTGHTGEDLILFTYLPGDDRITGTIDNTDLANIAAAVWGIDLGEVSKQLYNDAEAAFKANGAAVEINKDNPNNPVMIVTKGSTTMTIPESKNYVILNGDIIESMGVNVYIRTTEKFYIAQNIIELIP
ncbi:MAG: alkaline phosphatase [Oscillospiraceae bacterium]|nr:alkaline phosphatase [Oscillospiraceae bacterium]